MFVRRLLIADHVCMAICIENIFSVSERLAFCSMERTSSSTFVIWSCRYFCRQTKSKPSWLTNGVANADEPPVAIGTPIAVVVDAMILNPLQQLQDFYQKVTRRSK